MMTSRTQERKGFQIPTRVSLLETDVDKLETVSDERHAEVTKRLDTMNARLLGVLCSLIVAVLMLAANLAVHP